MIKETHIQVKVTNRNYKVYKELGYECKPIDTFLADVNNLPFGSNVKITAICEYCGSEKVIRYSTYSGSVLNGRKYACRCCHSTKTKETNLLKYGVTSVTQIKEIQDKRKATNLERYGFESSSKNVDVKNKMAQTCLNKYGTKSSMQNEDVYKKRLQSSFQIQQYKNTDLTYQASYELDYLETFSDKIRIENGKTFTYKYNGEDCTYYSDFYLPDYDLIVEIKSGYTYNLDKQKNLAKQKQVQSEHNFIFIIDKNYKEFKKIL